MGEADHYISEVVSCPCNTFFKATDPDASWLTWLLSTEIRAAALVGFYLFVWRQPVIAQKGMSSPGVHFQLVINTSPFYERGTHFAMFLP